MDRLEGSLIRKASEVLSLENIVGDKDFREVIGEYFCKDFSEGVQKSNWMGFLNIKFLFKFFANWKDVLFFLLIREILFEKNFVEKSFEEVKSIWVGDFFDDVECDI